jgi:hypothetical protein
VYVVDEPARPHASVYDLPLADANTRPEKGRGASGGPAMVDIGMTKIEFAAQLRRSVQECLVPLTGRLPN